MKVLFPERVDDFKLPNNDPEWNHLQDADSSELTLELLARAIRRVMRAVGSRHLSPSTWTHESRLVGVEGKLNQDVKTTASPTFVDLSATNVNAVTALKVNGTKVVGAQQTSWQTMLGAADTESQLDTGNPSLTLGELAQRVKGIQDCLATHGMILEDI